MPCSVNAIRSTPYLFASVVVCAILTSRTPLPDILFTCRDMNLQHPSVGSYPMFPNAGAMNLASLFRNCSSSIAAILEHAMRASSISSISSCHFSISKLLIPSFFHRSSFLSNSPLITLCLRSFFVSLTIPRSFSSVALSAPIAASFLCFSPALLPACFLLDFFPLCLPLPLASRSLICPTSPFAFVPLVPVVFLRSALALDLPRGLSLLWELPLRPVSLGPSSTLGRPGRRAVPPVFSLAHSLSPPVVPETEWRPLSLVRTGRLSQCLFEIGHSSRSWV